LTLAALRVRSFRFQWSADLLTSWAFEMETLVLGWFVMVHTGSVLLLTAFGSLQFLGTLAAPMFGVLGDRLGGRAMLCAMRATYAGLAAVLALLALTGSLTPVAVLVVAALGGIVRPNDLVMRNTLIGETIPPAAMMGALGMSRATSDSARVGGALAGAGLSTVLGVGVTYLAVTSLYAASLALTRGVARRTPVPDPAATMRGVPMPTPSSWRDLTDGLRRVLTTPELLAMMLLAFLINLSAYPASSGLLPYIARQVYGVDATGLGWLVASFAVGGLLASIAMVLTGGPLDAGVHRAVVRAAARLRSRAQPRRRAGHAAGGGVRAERGDDLDDLHAAGRRRRGIPRPRHGRPHAGRLRAAAGPDRLRPADRADRLPADDHRLGRARPGLHGPHRRPVAREPVAAPAHAAGRLAGPARVTPPLRWPAAAP
jgi:MFS family permease